MLPKYDYRVETTENIKNYIEESFSYIKDYSMNELYDELWTADSVTGKSSGSYTFFNAYEAEEMLCHNLDLLAEALESFGCENVNILENAEYCDVTIRCYLLSECLAEALEELGYNGTGLFPEEA